MSCLNQAFVIFKFNQLTIPPRKNNFFIQSTVLLSSKGTVMENIKLFLETSTIHGLSYITGSRPWVKLFWIVTVISGFITAGTEMGVGISILDFHASDFILGKSTVIKTIKLLGSWYVNMAYT